MLIASTAIATDPAINTSLIYDGAAFADLAGGLHRGNTYLGALRLQFAFQSRGPTVYVEGLSIQGGQPSEFAGLALASAHDRRSPTGGEITLEATYLAAINSHLAIQSDVQRVIHPNGSGATRNALVAIVEFELSFSRLLTVPIRGAATPRGREQLQAVAGRRR